MVSKCPLCKKEMVLEFKPFCSKRCKDIDLARWLRGDYFIAGDEKGDDESKEDENESH